MKSQATPHSTNRRSSESDKFLSRASMARAVGLAAVQALWRSYGDDNPVERGSPYRKLAVSWHMSVAITAHTTNYYARALRQYLRNHPRRSLVRDPRLQAVPLIPSSCEGCFLGRFGRAVLTARLPGTATSSPFRRMRPCAPCGPHGPPSRPGRTNMPVFRPLRHLRENLYVMLRKLQASWLSPGPMETAWLFWLWEL